MSEAAKEEYQPGLTELRLNSKSTLANYSEMFRRLETLTIAHNNLAKAVEGLKKSREYDEQCIRNLQAKLYENGIR